MTAVGTNQTSKDNRRMCPLLAQSGHSNRAAKCPLLGVKRVMSSEQTFALILRVQQHDPLGVDCNVDFLTHSNWLHSGATRDQMLIGPADVNLGEVALKDRFYNSR